MKMIILYPVPMESLEVQLMFMPFVQRFCDTFRKYDPGYEVDVLAITHGADDDDEVRHYFRDMPVRFVRYDGDGMDAGCHQWAARQLGDDCFVIGSTTRTYFHRSGWAHALEFHRSVNGPGLYGTCASREGGKLHICLRFYGMDNKLFKLYPHEITSRDQGVFYECGDGCLTDWFREWGIVTRVVTFLHSCYPEDDMLFPGSFRNGDQSEMLCWDKHTDYYRDASPEEKLRLEQMMTGEIPA